MISLHSSQKVSQYSTQLSSLDTCKAHKTVPLHSQLLLLLASRS